MNLLNLNLPRCHFHTLIELAKSGHNVYTNWNQAYAYETSLGIKCLTEEENTLIYQTASPVNISKNTAFVEQLIDKYNIDILQVCIPTCSYLHTDLKDKVKYIGPPEEVSLLETNKLYAKDIAKQLGIKVPDIIKRGKYFDKDYCKGLTFPCVEKPSHRWAPAVIINSQEEAAEAINKVERRDWPRDTDSDYYIEEYLHDMIETNVFFVISNGKYAITHTQEIIGEGLNKTINGDVWYFNTYIKPLSPSIDKIVRQEAEKYLDHIAKMGGSWEGSFCGAYVSGEWYFLETNVRPDIFNSTPIFMTGDEYLKGMFEDVSLFEKAWKDKTCQKLLITCDDNRNEYPIHLHDKYNIAYPNNLIIKDNKHFISNFAMGKLIKSRGTVVADHNIPKEFIKEIEETTPWKFNKDPS